MLDGEVSVIETELSKHAMRGEAEFVGKPKRYEQNGNVYVEVTCTDAEAVSGVREAFEAALADERVMSFRGPDVKNPATEERYVYVVAEPPFDK